jgi:hypothetical protein
VFFGKVYINDGDIAFDINGLRYFVDVEWSHAADELRAAAPSDAERSAELRRLAEVETEITITSGSFDQDIGSPQRPYPGGGLNIECYHIGRLTLVECGDNDYWQNADGSFNAPAEEIAASRANAYPAYAYQRYGGSSEQHT